MEQDVTVRLAERLRMDVEDFVGIFGAHWRKNDAPIAHDYDADPSGGEGFPVTPWMIQGDPPQLMIRVFQHGVFVARPVVPSDSQWDRLQYFPDGRDYLHRHEIADEASALVARLLAARRRTFRWCGCCRTSAPPELWGGEGRCRDCRWEWVPMVH